ncbi:MAG: hypothetical protein QOE92_2125 [Chloroflexota bacterium]|nr:hypothetical protein [Chloroflexota bacterium]
MAVAGGEAPWRRYGLPIAGLVALLAFGTVAVVLLNNRGPLGNNIGPTPNPTASVPVGDTASGGQGQDIGSIKCESHEVLAYHVHAHLYIVLDGAAQTVASQIGIPGGPLAPKCYYYLHTHDTSGIIHIESPGQAFYTLGQVFDIWGTPLNRTQVGFYQVPGGNLTTFVDGKQFDGDPRDVQLVNHTQVVLELGSQGPPPGFEFPSGL